MVARGRSGSLDLPRYAPRRAPPHGADQHEPKQAPTRVCAPSGGPTATAGIGGREFVREVFRSIRSDLPSPAIAPQLDVESRGAEGGPSGQLGLEPDAVRPLAQADLKGPIGAAADGVEPIHAATSPTCPVVRREGPTHRTIGLAVDERREQPGAGPGIVTGTQPDVHPHRINRAGAGTQGSAEVQFTASAVNDLQEAQRGRERRGCENGDGGGGRSARVTTGRELELEGSANRQGRSRLEPIATVRS